jgi:hypothetical protein
MRLAYLLATLIAICAVVHASTAKFVIPENTETPLEVADRVGAYIENLVERQSLNLVHNWTVQVALEQLSP